MEIWKVIIESISDPVDACEAEMDEPIVIVAHFNVQRRLRAQRLNLDL